MLLDAVRTVLDARILVGHGEEELVVFSRKLTAFLPQSKNIAKKLFLRITEEN